LICIVTARAKEAQALQIRDAKNKKFFLVLRASLSGLR